MLSYTVVVLSRAKTGCLAGVSMLSSFSWLLWGSYHLTLNRSQQIGIYWVKLSLASWHDAADVM